MDEAKLHALSLRMTTLIPGAEVNGRIVRTFGIVCYIVGVC